MPGDGKKVPLVVYTPQGRKIIGSATVHDDKINVEIEAEVTDPDMIERLSSGMTDHLSVGSADLRAEHWRPILGESVVESNLRAFKEDQEKGPIRRNVFDPKDDHGDHPSNYPGGG